MNRNVVIDFRAADTAPPVPYGLDPATLNEFGLRAYLFRGRLCFKVKGADFTRDSDSTPLLHAIISLTEAIEDLRASVDPSIFHYCENPGMLIFRPSKSGRSVHIGSADVNDVGDVSLAELNREIKAFSIRNLEYLIGQFPALERNKFLASWIRRHFGGQPRLSTLTRAKTVPRDVAMDFRMEDTLAPIPSGLHAATAGRVALRTFLFRGQLNLKVRNCDLTAEATDWEALLDVAMTFTEIIEALQRGSPEDKFYFIESSNQITFGLHKNKRLVTISSTYTKCNGTVRLAELDREVRAFTARTLKMLESRFPALKKNKALNKWLDAHFKTTSTSTRSRGGRTAAKKSGPSARPAR